MLSGVLVSLQAESLSARGSAWPQVMLALNVNTSASLVHPCARIQTVEMEARSMVAVEQDERQAKEFDETTESDTARTAHRTGPPRQPRAYGLAGFQYDTIIYEQPDTLLFGVWRYDPVMQPNFRAQLGVAGSASRSLWGGLGPFQVLSLGFGAVHATWNEEGGGLFYHKGDPFTRIDYTAGAGAALQRFGLLHTQDLGPTTSVGVDFRQLGSDGFYLNQEHRSRYTRLFGRLQDRSRRYVLHVDHQSRQKTAEECGGIANGRVFESTQPVAPLNVRVQLNGAESLWADRRLRLRQEWRLGQAPPVSGMGAERLKSSTDIKGGVNDSTPMPSTYSTLWGDSLGDKEHHKSKWAVFHEWTWARELFRYVDMNPLQPYLPLFRYSDSATFDSSGMNQQEHCLGLRRLAGRSDGSAWHLSVHYLNARILSDRMQSLPQSAFWLNGAGYWQASPRTRVDWDVRKVLHNRRQARGRWMELRLAQQVGRWTMNLQASNQLRAADWVAERYTGNYTQVNQSLAAMGERAARVSLSRGGFKLEGGYRLLTGWVYFDSLGQPQQHTADLGVTQIAYQWSIGRGIFRYDVHHGWQFGQSGPLRMPQWMAHDVISIEKRFRSGFSLSTGLELRMQSPYKALGYRPEVGQFVVQDTLNAGGYPLVDGFIALKVHNARLYLRMDHLSRGWTAPGGFQIPLYPIYDRALRFGISWDFYH